MPCPGTEPFLDPFSVTVKSNGNTEELYLPTSPEIHLKKLLTEGWTRIYEFKDCYRNGEMGDHHSPEFRMLEWYRSYSNLEQIQKDLQGLLNYIKLHWPDNIRGFGPLQKKSMAELFKDFCDFNLIPASTSDDLKELCRNLKIVFTSDDDFDDLFFRVFTDKIEPELSKMGPLIVYDYPPSQAAYARLTESGWADRFEFYWKGLEIANAFHEVNDPEIQKQRMIADNLKKEKLGRKAVGLDAEFFEALEAGMPPSGGIALGVDRLFMALTDLNHISKSKTFDITSYPS